MPIYTVTYCAMDGETGSNPLWHSCLLFSQFDEATKKMEVVQQWGFYSLPRAKPNIMFQFLTLKYAFDLNFISFELNGGHGMFNREETRFLDLGKGLHGLTFEFSQEKFHSLIAKCQKMVDEQNKAIDEIVTPLKIKPKDNSKIYSHEHLADAIYTIEKERAKSEGRAPRLHPFEFSFFGAANTCKAHILQLLSDELTEPQLAKIKGYNAAMPRLSGKMEKIYLHSSGPLSSHTKRSGEVVHFRDGKDANVKLYWTIPPQLIETLSGETRDLFKIYDGYSDEVRKVVSQLQQLEWFFLNTTIDERYSNCAVLLVKSIRDAYEVFAKIDGKKSQPIQQGFTMSSANCSALLSQSIHYASGVFANNGKQLNPISNNLATSLKRLNFLTPPESQEKELMRQIQHAQNIINKLYMAVIDGAEIDVSNHVIDLNDPRDEYKQEFDNFEAVAMHLSEESKKSLCGIIGRSYVERQVISNKSKLG